jgi:hypothetical protein
LDKLLFGDCFDGPGFQAVAGEVGGYSGSKVTHFNVGGIQKISENKITK